MQREPFPLPLRIVVDDPVPGLALALQRGQAGKAELVPPVSRSANAVVFDLEVTVGGRLPDGRPRLSGPYAQGAADARFVYLCVGAYAGQADAQWSGRIKVPLAGIDEEKIQALASGARLVARIAGRSPKGGPALASVPLLPPGWIQKPAS